MASAALTAVRPARERIPVMGTLVSAIGIVPAAWTLLFATLVGRAWVRLGRLPYVDPRDGVFPGVVHTPLHRSVFDVHADLVELLALLALPLGVVYPLGWLVVVLGERGVTRRWTWPVLALALWALLQLTLDPGGLFAWARD